MNYELEAQLYAEAYMEAGGEADVEEFIAMMPDLDPEMARVYVFDAIYEGRLSEIQMAHDAWERAKAALWAFRQGADGSHPLEDQHILVLEDAVYTARLRLLALCPSHTRRLRSSLGALAWLTLDG